MKIETDSRKPEKLCHAHVGEVVVLLDTTLAPVGNPLIVCVIPDADKRAARVGMPHGLYDEERGLFLVDLLTGSVLRSMPSLSQMVYIYRNATLRLK